MTHALHVFVQLYFPGAYMFKRPEWSRIFPTLKLNVDESNFIRHRILIHQSFAVFVFFRFLGGGGGGSGGCGGGCLLVKKRILPKHQRFSSQWQQDKSFPRVAGSRKGGGGDT